MYAPTAAVFQFGSAAYGTGIGFFTGGFQRGFNRDCPVIPAVFRQTAFFHAAILCAGVPMVAGITAPQRAEGMFLFGDFFCFGVIAYGTGKGPGACRVVGRFQRDFAPPCMRGLCGNLVTARICTRVPVFGFALGPIHAVVMACRPDGFRFGLLAHGAGVGL